jgi:hypothetical protein
VKPNADYSEMKSQSIAARFILDRRWQAGAIAILLLFLLWICLSSARHTTLTYDEADHYKYGLQILSLNSDRFDDSKMPFSALNALPGKAAEYLPQGQLRTYLAKITTGRIATMLFALLVAYFVYRWSRLLYGVIPGLFSLLLYVLEPNLIAHSRFVTTDLYAAGMVLISIYALWRYSQERTLKAALGFAFVLGIAQLAKYTSIFLYPLSVVLLLGHDLPRLLVWVKERETPHLLRYLRQTAGLFLLVLVISVLVINAGFLFNRTFTPLGDYKFESGLFQQLQENEILADLPVSLPYPYLEGLDLVRYRERSGFGYGKIYLLGDLRSGEGFPVYYLVAWLFKVPLAIQLAFLFSIIVYVWKWKKHNFLENEWFLFAPLLFFSLYFNLFYQAQIGIRYFLVIFPFVLIFCGNLLVGWESFSKARWVATVSLVAYLAISVFSYYPNFIPYFNELVLDRKMAYKILADSNLEWGQADGYVEDYLTAHPLAILNPEEPAAGTLVISPNNLLGISAKPVTYAWLRDNFEPVGTIANSYLIFDISQEQLNGIKGLRNK